MIKRFCFVLCLAFAVSTQASALPDSVASSENLEIRDGITAKKYTLKNGLTVVLIANPKAPVATVYHWVKAGSVHESKGITGIAHLFEHMMFRDVPGAPVKYDEYIQKIGASNNANTRFGSTVYYSVRIDAKHLKTVLQAEAFRFQNMKVTKELLDLEKKAVLSEYKSKIDSSPGTNLWTEFYYQGYPETSPYNWMIVGKRQDLAAITAEDCNAFFDKYYKAKNIGLFIGGPIDIEETLAWVDTYYKDMKPGVETTLPTFEPVGKTIVGKSTLGSKTKMYAMGFRIPEFTPQNAEKWLLLNHIFMNSTNNLARKRLRTDKKIVTDISDFNFFYDQSNFKWFVAPLQGVKTQDLIDNVLALVDDFANISAEEYEAYLREYQISEVDGVLKNDSLVKTMASAWGRYDDELIHIRSVKSKSKVTHKELVELARQYFHANNLIVMESLEAN